MARPPRGRDPARELFLRRTSAALGLGEGEIVDRLAAPLRSSLRVNPLRAADREATFQEVSGLGVELEPIPWCPDAYHLHGEKRRVVESAAFREGRVFLQNASSFVPPVVLDPQPGDRILDVCAAPGGKSAHLAAIVGNDAELWLNDALRADKLAEVVGLLGVQAASITRHPGQYLDKFVAGPFDRILLDAQCGGEGMLDLSHPGGLRFWSMERIRKYHHLQTSMLRCALRLLKPGGVVVYSTCTFAPEEDEGPVARVLRDEGEVTVEPIELPIPGRRPAVLSWEGERFPAELRGALRLAPSEWFEGFFVCKLRKGG